MKTFEFAVRCYVAPVAVGLGIVTALHVNSFVFNRLLLREDGRADTIDVGDIPPELERDIRQYLRNGDREPRGCVAAARASNAQTGPLDEAVTRSSGEQPGKDVFREY